MLAAIVVGAFLGYRDAQKSQSSLPRPLVVSEVDLDFGEVHAQKNFIQWVPVRNPTDRDVRILEIKSSCECTGVEPQQLLIPAGETRNVKVTLDLRHSARKTDENPAEFTATLSPTFDAPDSGGAAWKIQGEVWNVLRLKPDVLRMEFVHGGPLPVGRVAIHTTEPLLRVDASCDKESGVVTITPRETGEFVLEYYPNGEMPLGKSRVEVDLTPITHTGRSLPTTSAIVVASVFRNIHARPEALSFGLLDVGESHREFIEIRTHTEIPFRLADWQAPPGCTVSVEQDEGEHGGPIRLLVVQEGRQAGPASSVLTLRIQELGADAPASLDLPIVYVVRNPGAK